MNRKYDVIVIGGGHNGLVVGVGSNNSRGTFDNVVVQALPPQTSLENTEDFTDGIADLFTSRVARTWAVASGPLQRDALRHRSGHEPDDAAGRAAGDTTVDLERR